MRRSSVAGYSAAGDYWATAGIAVDSPAVFSQVSANSAVVYCRPTTPAADSAAIAPLCLIVGDCAIANHLATLPAKNSTAEEEGLVVGDNAVDNRWTTEDTTVDSAPVIGRIATYRAVGNLWVAFPLTADSAAESRRIAADNAVGDCRAAMVAVDSTPPVFFTVCNGETVQH